MPTINRRGRSYSTSKKRRPDPIFKQRNYSWASKSNYDIYNSYRWRKYNKSFAKLNPLCQACEAEGRYTPGQVTDHIIPINEGGSVEDSRNHMRMCRSCHNRKSARERYGTKIPHKLNEYGEKIPVDS